MSNLQINTRVRRLFYYLEDFEKGLIRVPIFQRNYKWDLKKRTKLFDSIKNGYPIGSILFWRPSENKDIEESGLEDIMIGSYIMNEKDPNFFYILDGFQRLSTLIGCLMNPENTNLERDDEDWYANFNIIYNLENGKFEENRKKNLDLLDINKIPVYKLADSKEFFKFQRKLYQQNLDENTIEKYLREYEETARKIGDYLIPSIDLIGGDTYGAIEIFDRVNSQGARMSDVEKLSAQTANNDFRLGSLINQTLNRSEIIKFYDKKNKKEAFRELIFRCIQSSFGVLYLDNSKTDVITLSKKNNFEETVNNTLDNIINVVEYLKKEFCITEFKFLPANLHFIFLVEYFNINGVPKPYDSFEIKRWFWKTTYSNYFTIYNPAKRKTSFEFFREFAFNNNDNPIYIDRNLSKLTTEKFPKVIEFGGVRKIALALFMVNYSIHKGNILNSDDYSKINEIREFKLFKSEKSSENVIFINDNQYDRLKDLLIKEKDMTFLLSKDFKGQFSELFINDEMRKAFEDNDIKKVLDIRYLLILDSERKFVQSLDIEYIE